MSGCYPTQRRIVASLSREDQSAVLNRSVTLSRENHFAPVDVLGRSVTLPREDPIFPWGCFEQVCHSKLREDQFAPRGTVTTKTNTTSCLLELLTDATLRGQEHFVPGLFRTGLLALNRDQLAPGAGLSRSAALSGEDQQAPWGCFEQQGAPGAVLGRLSSRFKRGMSRPSEPF